MFPASAELPSLAGIWSGVRRDGHRAQRSHRRTNRRPADYESLLGGRGQTNRESGTESVKLDDGQRGTWASYSAPRRAYWATSPKIVARIERIRSNSVCRYPSCTAWCARDGQVVEMFVRDPERSRASRRAG